MKRLHKLSIVHDESAQGVVEFAFIAMILMFIFLGTVDYGRFLYYDTALQSAVRTGGETAINRCYNPVICGTSSAPTPEDYVVQATYCEAAPYMKLQPAVTTCAPCMTATTTSSYPPTSSCTSPCGTACLSNVCQQDICISPNGTLQDQQDVTVTAGYSFKPISFLMSPFFKDQKCWDSDSTSSNHHTLCANSTGRVF